jgi:hypothetical protein
LELHGIIIGIASKRGLQDQVMFERCSVDADLKGLAII